MVVTILLVDDEPEFLALGHALLDVHPGVAIVGEAASGEEA